MTTAPSFYAARHGRGRDWWTLLHPPYTAWHLSYVVIGAALAPHFDGGRLVATLLAFFLAVGVAAHALDELHGRPLHTHVRSSTLVAAAIVGLGGALALGVAGVTVVGPGLVVFIAIGPALVLGYNLELFGGWVHTDLGFALAWGAFPVLTAYYVEAERVDAVAAVGALAAVFFSLAQRALSTRARNVRRRVTRVTGTIELRDGTRRVIDERYLLAPIERALRAMAWGMVVLATALATARWR